MSCVLQDETRAKFMDFPSPRSGDDGNYGETFKTTLYYGKKSGLRSQGFALDYPCCFFLTL